MRAAVRLAVSALSATLALVVSGSAGARAAPSGSIPPASWWAIQETMRTYGNRTITLPADYTFTKWFRRASAVRGHTGRDTVVEFSRGAGLAATWIATPISKRTEAGCPALFGPHPARYTFGRHTVYVADHRQGMTAWICVADYARYRILYRLWDRHHLSARELAEIVGRSRYRYLYTVSPFVDFWTPSGNIGCLAQVPGQGLDPGGIICVIKSGLQPPPGRKPAACGAGTYGWGKVVTLELPSSPSAHSGPAEYDCSYFLAPLDAEPIDTSAPTLAYGRTVRFAGVVCRSQRNGLQCANQDHHGFFLSRQHSDVW